MLLLAGASFPADATVWPDWAENPREHPASARRMAQAVTGHHGVRAQRK
jgi:hypothetical protein